MFNLLFTNPLMLAALAALGIPVLIHLLLKRRKNKVPFSTIRFFRLQDEQSSRRRKLRNWLLLALRLLIVSLLVLAFARPFAQRGQAPVAGRKPHRVVFVLDRSASMLAAGTDGQRWALAKQQVLKALDGLHAEDSVALVVCGRHADVLSAFAPPSALVPVVRELSPGYGTASVSDGLQQAVRLLTGGPSDSASSIYLVTDLQKTGCRGLKSCPLPQAIELQVLPVGDFASPNLALVRLDLDVAQSGLAQADVVSFSDENCSSASLDLTVDDQHLGPLSFALKAGASTNLGLALPALKSGWHQLKASLRCRDALAVDNTRYACFFAPEPARVLVVEPRPNDRIFEHETFFLSAALNPAEDTTNSVPGAFNLREIPRDGLIGELSRPNPGAAWNVVILPGLKEMPEGLGKTLLSFVRTGGGLVLFLGEGMSANRYNSELAELLPARIGAPEEAPDVDSAWRIALIDTNTPPFAAFGSPNSGDLRIPQFTQRYSLEPASDCARLAFFEDGQPLVVTRAVGQGRVILVNSSAGTAWNDWPKHKTFVPFVHGLVTYAAQKAIHDNFNEPAEYLAGEDAVLDLGPKASRSEYTLQRPDGQQSRLIADARGVLQDPRLDVPGAYSLRDAAGHELRRIAVNVPAEESNLEALRPADFEGQLVRTRDNPKQTLAAGLFGARHDQREYWTALLLSALILLLVEPFVANRTSI